MKPINYRILPEDELIPLMSTGDQKAFAEVFDRYHHFLLTYADRLTQDVDESEDLIQEVFIRAWEKRERFVDSTSLFNYLKVSVRNGFLNQERHKETDSTFRKEIAAIAPDTAISTDEILREQELVRRLESIARSLPGKMGEVFLMTHFERYSNEEIAAALHVSEKTVKNLLSRAATNIKLRLGLTITLFFLITHPN